MSSKYWVLLLNVFWVLVSCGPKEKKETSALSQLENEQRSFPNHRNLSVKVKPSNLRYTINGNGPFNADKVFSLKDGRHLIKVVDPCFQSRAQAVEIKGADKAIVLNGLKRVSLVKVNIRDKRGKPAKGDVLIDKIQYGKKSGTYQVPLCAKVLEVEAGLFSGEAHLNLHENKKTTYTVTLAKRGLLTQNQIDDVIHSKMPEIHQCFFNKRLKSDGKLHLFFGIRTDGTVYFSRIRYSTIPDDEVNQCILNKSTTWVFPKPRGGGSVKVDYPFIFNSYVPEDVPKFNIAYSRPSVVGVINVNEVLSVLKTKDQDVAKCLQIAQQNVDSFSDYQDIAYELTIAASGRVENSDVRSMRHRQLESDGGLANCIQDLYKSLFFNRYSQNTKVRGAIEIRNPNKHSVEKKQIEVLKKIKPEFPKRLQYLSNGKSCLATITINPKGIPVDVVVKTSSKCPSALHNFLESNLYRWQFSPMDSRVSFDINIDL